MKHRFMKTVLASLCVLGAVEGMAAQHSMHSQKAAAYNKSSDDNQTEVLVSGGGHVYLGFGVGYGSLDTGPSGADDGGFAWQVNGGYLAPTSHEKLSWGGDVSFSGFPDAKYQGVSVLKGNSLGASAVLEYAFLPQLKGVLKTGLAFSFQKDVPNSNSSVNLVPTEYLGVRVDVVKTNSVIIGLNLGYQYVADHLPMYGALAGLNIGI